MEKRKIISDLASAYQKRSDASQSNKARKTDSITPDYIDEVVIPIIKMLADELNDKRLIIPQRETYALQGGLFRIKIGTATVGGLSYPTKNDHRVYYTRLFKQRPIGERIEITSIKQLADIIREQLKERRKRKEEFDDERNK